MIPQIVVKVSAEFIDEDSAVTLSVERTVGQELDPNVLGLDVYDGFRGSLAIASDSVSTMIAAMYPHGSAD